MLLSICYGRYYCASSSGLFLLFIAALFFAVTATVSGSDEVSPCELLNEPTQKHEWSFKIGHSSKGIQRTPSVFCPYDEIILKWVLPDAQQQWQTGVVVYKQHNNFANYEVESTESAFQISSQSTAKSTLQKLWTLNSTQTKKIEQQKQQRLHKQHQAGLPVVFIPIDIPTRLSPTANGKKKTERATINNTWRRRQAIGCDVDDVACDVPPKLVAVIASEGYGPGSTMTLDFDKDTDTPYADSKAQVDALVIFSGSMGRSYSATWPTRRRMIITVTDPHGHAQYHDGGFSASLALTTDDDDDAILDSDDDIIVSPTFKNNSVKDAHAFDRSFRHEGTQLLRLGSAGNYTLRLACFRKDQIGTEGNVQNSQDHSNDNPNEFVLGESDLSAEVQVAMEGTCRVTSTTKSNDNTCLNSDHSFTSNTDNNNNIHNSTRSNMNSTTTVVTADEITAATNAFVHNHQIQTNLPVPSLLALFRQSMHQQQHHRQQQHTPQSIVLHPTWKLQGPLALDGTAAAVTQMPAALGLSTLIPKTWSISFWVLLTDDHSTFNIADETKSKANSKAHRALFYHGWGKGYEKGSRTPSAWLIPGSNLVALRISTQDAFDAGFNSNVPVVPGRWTHLSFTMGFVEPATTQQQQQQQYRVRAYINGERVVEILVQDGNTATSFNGGPLHIGKDPWNEGLSGLISGVHVFDSELTGVQVQSDLDKAVFDDCSIRHVINKSSHIQDVNRSVHGSRLGLGRESGNGNGGAHPLACPIELPRVSFVNEFDVDGWVAGVMGSTPTSTPSRTSSKLSKSRTLHVELTDDARMINEIWTDAHTQLTDEFMKCREIGELDVSIVKHSIDMIGLVANADVSQDDDDAEVINVSDVSNSANLCLASMRIFGRPDGLNGFPGEGFRTARCSKLSLEAIPRDLALAHQNLMKSVGLDKNQNIEQKGEALYWLGMLEAMRAAVLPAYETRVEKWQEIVNRDGSLTANDAENNNNNNNDDDNDKNDNDNKKNSYNKNSNSNNNSQTPKEEEYKRESVVAVVASGDTMANRFFLLAAASDGHAPSKLALAQRVAYTDTTSYFHNYHHYHHLEQQQEEQEEQKQSDCETVAAYLSQVGLFAQNEHHQVGHEPHVEMQRLWDFVEETGQRGDEDEVVQFQLLRANRGDDPDAMVTVGSYYYWGSHGLARDQARAFKLFEGAAELGHKVGMTAAGNLLLKGEGVAKNTTGAIEWYEKAVELGEPGALNGLGYLNFFGKEIPQNLTRSLELFLLHGRDGDSLFNAGYQFLHAMGTPRDAQRGVDLLKKAAHQFGHFQAMYLLGKVYLHGPLLAVGASEQDHAAGGMSAQTSRSCETGVHFMRKAALVASWGNSLRRGFDAFLERDFESALLYYTEASELGYPRGAANAAWLTQAKGVSGAYLLWGMSAATIDNVEQLRKINGLQAAETVVQNEMIEAARQNDMLATTTTRQREALSKATAVQKEKHANIKPTQTETEATAKAKLNEALQAASESENLASATAIQQEILATPKETLASELFDAKVKQDQEQSKPDIPTSAQMTPTVVVGGTGGADELTSWLALRHLDRAVWGTRVQSHDYDAFSQLLIGDFWFYGKGGSVDTRKAMKHWALASAKGNWGVGALSRSQASYNLGWMYELGLVDKEHINIDKNKINEEQTGEGPNEQERRNGVLPPDLARFEIARRYYERSLSQLLQQQKQQQQAGGGMLDSDIEDPTQGYAGVAVQAALWRLAARESLERRIADLHESRGKGGLSAYVSQGLLSVLQFHDKWFGGGRGRMGTDGPGRLEDGSPLDEEQAQAGHEVLGAYCMYIMKVVKMEDWWLLVFCTCALVTVVLVRQIRRRQHRGVSGEGVHIA